jgi:hypothetical protein
MVLIDMQTLRPSAAWRVIIVLALLLGAQPAMRPCQAELSPRNDDQLLQSRQSLEPFALTKLSGKKDFSKLTPAGLMPDCPVVVQLSGTIFSVSLLGSGPQPSVLSFSHNRSPPSL